MNKVLKVKCPTCKEKFEYSLSEFRPFCSEKCKLIDLGNWADGNYAIPSSSQLSEEDLERVIRDRESTDE